MRIGILTSGGDCQALNATMSSFVKTIYQHNEDVEIIGFKYGFYYPVFQGMEGYHTDSAARIQQINHIVQ